MIFVMKMNENDKADDADDTDDADGIRMRQITSYFFTVYSGSKVMKVTVPRSEAEDTQGTDDTYGTEDTDGTDGTDDKEEQRMHVIQIMQMISSLARGMRRTIQTDVP